MIANGQLDAAEDNRLVGQRRVECDRIDNAVPLSGRCVAEEIVRSEIKALFPPPVNPDN